MKINFWKIFWGYWRVVLKSAALEELDRISAIIAGGDIVAISTAKKRLCRAIQSKKRVPGEIRRVLENLVNDIEAEDVSLWLIRARLVIESS